MSSRNRIRASGYAGIPAFLAMAFVTGLLLRCGDGSGAIEAASPARPGQAGSSAEARTPVDDRATAARLLDAVRGAEPVVCELAARAVRSRDGYWGQTPHPAAVDDAEVLGAVEFAVGSGGEGTEEVLAAALPDPDPCVRRIAAMRLGRVGTEEAHRRLAETLEGANAPAREAAAVGLGIADDARAIPALARRLAEDGDARVRRAAAWAIGKIDG